MTVPNDVDVQELVTLFKRLRDIMRAEGDAMWCGGVEAIIQRLTPPVTETDWQEVISLYRTMYSGAGGLGDFHVWRDDFDARLAANDDVRGITEGLWLRLRDAS
jgi:hypothetical protein